MLFRISICFLFLYSQMVSAQNKVWVNSGKTVFREFQVFLKSSSDSNLSYAEFQFQQRRKRAGAFKLKEKLLSAQHFYLDGKKERAKKIFNQIIRLAYSADWNKEERRIIMYSFFRSAQLEEEEEKKQAFLILAGSFSIIPISPRVYSDFSLFPPPLMEKLNQIQMKNNFLSINWNRIFPNHEIILLNGKRIEKNKEIELPQALYRVTALSSSHQAWSQKISLSKLLFKEIKTEKLTLGSCKSLKLIPKLEKQRRFNLFPVSKCPKIDPLDWNSAQTKDKELFGFAEKEEAEESEKKPSYLSSWFLLGVGILTLSLILFLNSGKDEPEEEIEDYIY